jgi:hypothetical protein
LKLASAEWQRVTDQVDEIERMSRLSSKIELR